MSSLESNTQQAPRLLKIWTDKPPEEVRVFGVRGADIKAIWAPPDEEEPIFPDDRGFTGTNAHGLCNYCQLLLSPQPPGKTKLTVLAHQPSLQALISSVCQVCSWLEFSIKQSCPRLVELYGQGDPEICDTHSTNYRITVSLERMSRHTQAIACVGARGDLAEIGVPLNITSLAQLGDLRTRVFWQPYETRDTKKPSERLSILKTWLTECHDHHEVCRSAYHNSRNHALPSRVLDLTGSQDIPTTPEDIKVRLHVTSEVELGKYVALSYCWGSETKYHFTTTTKNIKRFRDAIDFESLPLTHREAILVTLYLGIRYLWIDSLCILQDCPDDWKSEAAKMSAVYANAELTLAAAASNGPQGGLLEPFQSARCVPVDDDLAMVRLQTHTKVDSSSEPLNTRAWTLQEAVIPRRIVSFGSDQWLWRCASQYATEDGLEVRPTLASERLWRAPDATTTLSADALRLYLRHWYDLVCSYSKRELTYQKDKLAAIAGLAEICSKQTGFTYILGLWVEDIGNGLMWQATSRGVSRSTGNVAIPSWSWASVKGAVLKSDFSRDTSMIELLKIEQNLQDSGLAAQTLCGPTRLHVRGAQIKAQLGKQSLTQKLRYHLVDGDEILGECFLDGPDTVEQGIFEIVCLRVFLIPAADERLEHYVLLLVPVLDRNGQISTQAYRRIGIGIVWRISRHEDGSDGSIEPFLDVSVSDVILE